jgi:hypothetical protein
MPTAGPLMYGENAEGVPTVVSTDNSGNVNVNVVSGGGGTSGNGTVAISGGTVTALLSGSQSFSISSGSTFALAPGSSVGITGTPTVALSNGSMVTLAAGAAVSLTGTPTVALSAGGTVTALPSGTQAVSGSVALSAGSTITTLPGGTQTVAGTLTTTPTGTQSIAGTVALSAGGTVTTSPSGTQAVSQAPLLASGVAPVAGTFTAAGSSPSFVPAAGRPFNIALWSSTGTAASTSLGGTVYLARSIDGGTTFLPLTANGTQLELFTAVASENWSESQFAVPYELVCTSSVTGTIYYRLSQ